MPIGTSLSVEPLPFTFGCAVGEPFTGVAATDSGSGGVATLGMNGSAQGGFGSGENWIFTTWLSDFK